MPTLKRTVWICDHCYNFHQKFAPSIRFNFALKEEFAQCTLCDEHNVLCKDCYQHSSTELKDSILSSLGIVICRKCFEEVRYVSDAQQRLEAVAQEYVKELQVKMRQKAYFLTSELAWKLS